MTIDGEPTLKDVFEQLAQSDAPPGQIGKETLRIIVGLFEKSANNIFKDWDLLRPRWVDVTSRSQLEKARGTLREWLDKLASDDFELGHDGETYGLVIELISAIHTVTKLSTSAVDNYLHPRRQAAHARAKRRENPRETALLVAIEREFGAGHSAQPWKDAASILDGVNGRLESLKFAPVKVDVIRRRLENRSSCWRIFPRS
jgi:hypothetical protein